MTVNDTEPAVMDLAQFVESLGATVFLSPGPVPEGRQSEVVRNVGRGVQVSSKAVRNKRR